MTATGGDASLDDFMMRRQTITGTYQSSVVLGTVDPNFVIGEGCGSRKFEHDLTPQQTRREKTRKGEAPFVVGGDAAVRGSLPWQVCLFFFGCHNWQ